MIRNDGRGQLIPTERINLRPTGIPARQLQAEHGLTQALHYALRAAGAAGRRFRGPARPDRQPGNPIQRPNAPL
jgi:hypothetical protein